MMRSNSLSVQDRLAFERYVAGLGGHAPIYGGGGGSNLQATGSFGGFSLPLQTSTTLLGANSASQLFQQGLTTGVDLARLRGQMTSSVNGLQQLPLLNAFHRDRLLSPLSVDLPPSQRQLLQRQQLLRQQLQQDSEADKQLMLRYLAGNAAKETRDMPLLPQSSDFGAYGINWTTVAQGQQLEIDTMANHINLLRARRAIERKLALAATSAGLTIPSEQLRYDKNIANQVGSETMKLNKLLQPKFTPSRELPVNESFPRALYQLLKDTEEHGRSDVVAFSPNNNAVCIYKPKVFIEEICPHYFTFTRLSSFKRQLQLYKFTRASVQEGLTKTVNSPDGPFAYSHASFVKGRPELLKEVKRDKRRKSTQRDIIKGIDEAIELSNSVTGSDESLVQHVSP